MSIQIKAEHIGFFPDHSTARAYQKVQKAAAEIEEVADFFRQQDGSKDDMNYAAGVVVLLDAFRAKDDGPSQQLSGTLTYSSSDDGRRSLVAEDSFSSDNHYYSVQREERGCKTSYESHHVGGFIIADNGDITIAGPSRPSTAWALDPED